MVNETDRSSEHIQYFEVETEGGMYARLHLNRPEAGNLVNDSMFQALIQHLEQLHESTQVKALLLSGEGSDFCLGRDRKPPTGSPTPLQIRENLRRITQLNTLLATLPFPTIAVVHGKAFGMGAGLTMQCDLTIAAEGSQLAFPEMKHDLPPTIVLSYLGRHLPPKQLFELIALGHPLDTDVAKRWGLINWVVPREDLLAEAERVAEQLVRRSGLALQTLKQFLRQARDLPEATSYELGINVLANLSANRSVGLFD